MDCPRCKLPLTSDKYEGVDVDICGACWGVWLDSGELELILKAKDFKFSEEEKKLILKTRAAGQKVPPPIACPKCGVRMERLNLDPSLHLVIDRCQQHGVWLDTGEIKAIQAMADVSQQVSRLLIQKIHEQTRRD